MSEIFITPKKVLSVKEILTLAPGGSFFDYKCMDTVYTTDGIKDMIIKGVGWDAIDPLKKTPAATEYWLNHKHPLR
jgi:hypothetical protein